MRLLTVLACGVVLWVVGCGDQSGQTRPISSAMPIAVYRAQAPQGLERQAPGPGWQAVTFEGKHFLVAASPIFTERNIVGARPIRGTPGALEVVLDESGRQALSEATAERASAKQPLGIKVGDRWTGFPTVMARLSGGRARLVGLTDAEMAAVLGTGG
jgi:hypothetical protein